MRKKLSVGQKTTSALLLLFILWGCVSTNTRTSELTDAKSIMIKKWKDIKSIEGYKIFATDYPELDVYYGVTACDYSKTSTAFVYDRRTSQILLHAFFIQFDNDENAGSMISVNPITVKEGAFNEQVRGTAPGGWSGKISSGNASGEIAYGWSFSRGGKKATVCKEWQTNLIK